MKNDLNSNERKKYIKYKVVYEYIISIMKKVILFIPFIILSTIFINKCTKISKFGVLIIFFAILLLFIIFKFIIELLFICSKKIMIIDGYISKKYRKKIRDISDRGSDYIAILAKATSNDKSYTTGWLRFNEDYLKYKDIPVKIVIKNGRAVKFYIDDYSFKNEKNINENLVFKKILWKKIYSKESNMNRDVLSFIIGIFAYILMLLLLLFMVNKII